MRMTEEQKKNLKEASEDFGGYLFGEEDGENEENEREEESDSTTET